MRMVIGRSKLPLSLPVLNSDWHPISGPPPAHFAPPPPLPLGWLLLSNQSNLFHQDLQPGPWSLFLSQMCQTYQNYSRSMFITYTGGHRNSKEECLPITLWSLFWVIQQKDDRKHARRPFGMAINKMMWPSQTPDLNPVKILSFVVAMPFYIVFIRIWTTFQTLVLHFVIVISYFNIVIFFNFMFVKQKTAVSKTLCKFSDRCVL